MFTILFYLIILLEINERHSSDLPDENDLDPFDRYELLKNQEYRMLMNYEQRKSKLRKSWNSRGVFSDLVVVKTKEIRRLRDIAENYGFLFVRKVFEDDHFYLFRRTGHRKRYKRRMPGFFKKHSKVQWAARQSLQDRYPRKDSDHLLSEVKKLVFRETHKTSSRASLKFNDPLFGEQWYLHNTGQTGSPPHNDINVYPVWQSGITGRGVAISVLDDGVFDQSEEVSENYDPASSEDYLFQRAFLPIAENSHGTRCAAIAAGVANNAVCGVGVAFEASVGGIRLLDQTLTDVQEAMALVHAMNHVDIYTASWGPSDKGAAVDEPKLLTRMSFVKGVTMGRQGKGSIYVWASGNGGGYHDNCSLDGYASSPFTLTIGALTEDGLSTFYSEPCPAVIASAYVGGSSHEVPSSDVWKEDKKKIKVVVPEGRGKCKETFQGTSAAAPMAAGVIALLLQANPRLTWRDVQHLIIRTSRIPNTGEDGWLTNGAGFRFHPKIGSGVLDAHALVTLAKKWTNVGSLRVWTSPAKRKKRPLPPRKVTPILLQVVKSSMENQSRIDQIETVILTVNLRHKRRGDLGMVLESPSGTQSQILTRRPHDNSTAGFDHWDFVSLHFWGEDPEGVWKLRVLNHNKEIMGYIDFVTITFFGTSHL